MRERREEKLHANAVSTEDVLNYVKIVDACFKREMYAEPKPIYELRGGDAARCSFYMLLTAACFRMFDELKEATVVYEYIKPAHPTNNKAQMKIAKDHAIMGEPRKTLERGSCLRVVLSGEMLDYAEIADAYFERGMYAGEARLQIRAPALGGDLGYPLRATACLWVLDELKESMEVYKYIKLADPINNNAKMKLVKVYEMVGESRKALDLVYEGPIQLGRVDLP